MRWLGFALLVASLGLGKGRAEGAPETKTQADAAAEPRKGKPRATAIPNTGRRRTGAKVLGWVVPERKLRRTPAERPSGNLHLVAVATHEELKVNIYNADGSYSVEALTEVSHLLRCRRTDAEKDIEPRLLTMLSHVYDQFDERPIQVVSAFRNQRRTTSYHFKAAAIDIRVRGVKPAKVKTFLESLDAGGMGIGMYPRTGFVHVDVRPPPSYRWIDWSRSNPDAPDKRPPRGWKKKKLQS